jgi:hypothetical protein
MKYPRASFALKTFLTFLYLSNSIVSSAQQSPITPAGKSIFWQKVQIGGGLALSIGSGFTDITVAPSAIYNFNKYVAAGVGLQGTYSSSKNYYTSAIYGASLVGLFNPIEQVQLSVEIEQSRVNNDYQIVDHSNLKDNFWNTGLFFGAGYRTGNVTIGGRYNVLYNKNDYVYGDAFMPFVRVYF